MEKTRPSSSSSASGISSLESYFNQGADFTRRGLTAEETGNVGGHARTYYARAVEFFDRGLKVRGIASADQGRAQTLVDAILRNREAVVGRLLVLPAAPPSDKEPIIPLEEESSLMDRLANIFVPNVKPPKPLSSSGNDWVMPEAEVTPPPHRIVSINTGVSRTNSAPPKTPQGRNSVNSVAPKNASRTNLTSSDSKESSNKSGNVNKTAEAVSAAPELVGVDPAMQRRILDVAVDSSPGIHWSDVAGLDEAKRALYEVVILPTLRPDLFTGLRQPASGVLLFGPPGCGKTMLAKAVATEAGCAFFCISAASLMSKFLGESEGLVKALFGVARYVAPAVIFIDEIDALLSERSDKEHEASRRVKTEFLIQWDGLQAHASAEPKRILVMGATNRPGDLDDAAIRRMPQRVYIPLPDIPSRGVSLRKLMQSTKNSLSDSDYSYITDKSEMYSQSDLKSLCQQAAMEPLRELGPVNVLTAPASQVRGVMRKDFDVAFRYARSSVPQESLAMFEKWSSKYGMGS